ncbi:MAG: 50S ribosomal protein L22 [Candidatus Dojkabacteria bacterium]|nr:MAG: 50S ribosomal protein L22 [Candidatus Dojkabacteria bacterium]
MENRTVKTQVKNIAQSPLKLRLVANMVRGKNAAEAMEMMKFVNKKGANFVYKALKGALADAENNYNMDGKDLFVSHISVDGATPYKRGRYASRGRASRILKRRSHLNLELSVKS